VPAEARPPEGVLLTGRGGRLARLLRGVPGWEAGAVAWHGRADGPLAPALGGRRAVVALGGVTAGDARALAANAAAARDALEAAAQAGVRRVLLLSSAAVYGPGRGLSEAGPARPVSEYGRAKLEMERAVAAWVAARPGAPEACCLRLGNVAGADALLGRLRPGRRPRLDTFADGATPARSFVGIATFARLLAGLLRHPGPLPPVLNLAAPRAVAMGALLRAAGRPWEAVPAPPAALREVSMDMGRAEALLGFAPEDSEPEEIVRQWRAATDGGAA
jgi:nucleoside-diphosphate-sugar epimerase